jgi:hypothetical protein
LEILTKRHTFPTFVIPDGPKVPKMKLLPEKVTPPKPGETRFKRRFAWLPTLAGGYMVWLEKYEVMCAYVVIQYQVIVAEKVVTVSHGEWKELSTRLINKK